MVKTRARINAEEVFRQLADALARSGQEDFFTSLIVQLEELLQVDHVILASVNEASHEAVTLAVASHGKLISNFTYPLEGTPCETIHGSEPCLYNGAVAEQFPNDDLLRELKVESYLGMPIVNTEGRKLGLLAVMQNTSMQLPELGREVLRIAASQIGAEMVRQDGERRIQQLAYEDSLTGLPNRLKLQEYVDRALAQSHREQSAVGMVIVDLRRFKEINDTHGHQAGDRLLVLVAQRLRSLLRDGEFLARQSSDEYVIVLPCADQVGVQDMIDKIQRGLTDPFSIMQRRFAIEINIGAAIYPFDSDTASELFQHASIALDHAKMDVSRVCIYDSSMAELLYRKHRLLSRFTKALKEEKLELFYQPQFRLKDKGIVGAEALCRWHDEELGWVSPAEFIPLAEERGLIRELGSWVIREAARQLAVWLEAGVDFPGSLSINLSAQQFDDLTLVEELVRATEAVGSHRIMLELTESVMMREPEQALAITRDLESAGFRTAVDDFGTGYSSLAYLQRLAIHSVKIDKSFIMELVDNEQNQSIVRAIIAMADSLGLSTIAEGVKTQKQAELLSEIGCRLVQGFFFGRPVNADEFASKWLVQQVAE
ncbi:MAG: sensor domain-containing phosphodiesterase [Idiomarina sp.]|nr:sensor domain-containing phosphodiesterase [Idiomarina sp.]